MASSKKDFSVKSQKPKKWLHFKKKKQEKKTRINNQDESEKEKSVSPGAGREYEEADKVNTILTAYENKCVNLYCQDNIPGHIKDNICKKVFNHGEDQIVGLIDLSTDGSAKKFLLFAQQGIFYYNSWSSKNPGIHYISYKNLSERHLGWYNKRELFMGGNDFLNVDSFFGSKEKREEIVDLLNIIRNIFYTNGDNQAMILGIEAELRNYCDWDRLYLPPNFPGEKEKNARKKNHLPDNFKILGLIDLSFFGSAKNSLVFGEMGIYYHNYWGSSRPGNYFISYKEMDRCKLHFRSFGKLKIALGENHYLNLSSLSGHEEDKMKMFELLKSVYNIGSSSLSLGGGNT